MVGQGWLTPEQFWRLHPVELWWLIDAKRPPKMYGTMTEHEVAELYEELMEGERAHGH